jgi:hypothetical protein
MKRLLIWGTGKVAEAFIKNIVNGEIIGFIDSKKDKDYFKQKPVFYPEEALSLDYDALIIASSYADEITAQCMQLGIDADKIIYLRNFRRFVNLNRNLTLLKDVVNEKAYQELGCKDQYLILHKMNYDLINESVLNTYSTETYQSDYSRYRTFELAAELIIENGIRGAVAEVGVNVGTFARIINAKFPERSLYLFDTFDSFDPEEFNQELQKGNCNQDFLEIFKIADEEKVLKEMPHPERCIIKKGFFPGTAKDLEEEFAFVSIDVDFEESIYHSLEYFYPRLQEGGYLFIHDYNNNFLFGVKSAVRRYEEKFGVLKKLPLADNGGTLIIIK